MSGLSVELRLVPSHIVCCQYSAVLCSADEHCSALAFQFNASHVLIEQSTSSSLKTERKNSKWKKKKKWRIERWKKKPELPSVIWVAGSCLASFHFERSPLLTCFPFVYWLTLFSFQAHCSGYTSCQWWLGEMMLCWYSSWHIRAVVICMIKLFIVGGVCVRVCVYFF